MFNVNKPISFTRDVPLQVPDGDTLREDTIKATFTLLDDDLIETLDQHSETGMKEFLRLSLTNLGDILGDDNKPLSYSEELREQMLKLPFVRLALYLAYNKAVTQARLGN